MITRQGRTVKTSWNQVEMVQHATTRLMLSGRRVVTEFQPGRVRAKKSLSVLVCDGGVAAHYRVAHFCVIQICAMKNPFEFGRELGIGELVDRNSEVYEGWAWPMGV